jgi:SAM-dependent methyltransferase
MQSLISSILKFLIFFGFNPAIMINSIIGIPHYIKDYYLIRRQIKNKLHKQTKLSFFPCLTDKISNGPTKGHYFHQDLLVARRIFENKPILHVDIGSRIDGFVAHVAAFRSIEVFDIRPIFNKVSNIHFRQLDFMKPISDELEGYSDSASCLHALEHFGLGRYGDPLEINGHIQGLDNLYRILKNDGKLYLSIPIGESRIEFNAHRVFSINDLLELFEGRFRLDNFSYIDDHGEMHENSIIDEATISNNANCHYGCGIFELTKIDPNKVGIR